LTFDAETLNAALSMSLEWGPVRNTPMEERLAERFPILTPREVMALKLTCAEAESLAWRQYERMYLKEIPQAEADSSILSAFPWISLDNMASLFSQGQYYAWHDNG
jgi:hypothetical protein